MMAEDQALNHMTVGDQAMDLYMRVHDELIEAVHAEASSEDPMEQLAQAFTTSFQFKGLNEGSSRGTQNAPNQKEALREY
jgi:hypothetical protein